MSKRKLFQDTTYSAKRPRTDLTLDQKREIINWVEMQPKKPSYDFIKDFFSAKLGVKIGRTAIGEILAKADKYFENENIRAYGSKRLRDAEQVHLEKALYLWYGEMRAYGCPLSDQMLITKALQIRER